MDNKQELAGVPVLSWLGEPVKQSVNSVFNGINTGVEALDLFKKYRNTHFKQLKPQISKIKILGMTSPIELTDIYSPANLSTTIHGRLYKQEWHDATDKEGTGKATKSSKDSKLVRGDLFVEKTHRTVVLGGPGSGKTTFLRHLALSYSDKNVFETTQLQTSKFPVFIHLPLFAKSNLSFFDFIATPLLSKTDKYAHDFLMRVFDKGLGILLFDSLDEVPIGERSRVIKDIKSLCALFPDCKAVLTCRTADYEEVFEDFEETEIARLSSTAVTKVIRSESVN